MFAEQSSDARLDHDLDSRRYRNDKLLKSRFESIFEKYAHDFSGVGDEIDLVTGELVVNNGHLAGIEHETDTSAGRHSKGQSILRAMTEAPGPEDSYFDNEGADDVMQSIEEIAENAAMSEEEDVPADSDEELFAPVESHPAFSTILDLRENSTTLNSDPTHSDSDSLFEVPGRQRSGSPDSLFDVKSPPKTLDDSTCTIKPHRHSSALYEDIDETVILEKFGVEVGYEVLEIVGRAKNMAEAHIEPAWRIPANVIPPKPNRTPSKSKTPPKDILPPAEVQSPPASECAVSLWKPGRRRSGRVKRKASVQRPTRAESQDPLQEGFQSDDSFQGDSGNDSGYRDEDDEEDDWNPKRRREDDEHIVLMKQGICAFCHGKWARRAGVFNHWAHVLARSNVTGADLDDVHDLDYIRNYRSKSNTRSRAPRITLGDFKTMVEFHEGAGLSFAEIASSKVLRTRKTAAVLNDVYDKFRTPPVVDGANENGREWSEEEMTILNGLCQNPLRELATFTRQLRDCSNTDVGDKLAEIWLKPFRESRGRPLKPQDEKARAIQQGGRSHRREPSTDPLFIKKEDSDDELFGRR